MTHAHDSHELPPAELAALLRLWGRLRLLDALGIDTASIADPLAKRLRAAGIDLLGERKATDEADAQAAPNADFAADVRSCEVLANEAETQANRQFAEAEKQLRHALIDAGVDPQIAMNPPVEPAVPLPEPLLAALATGNAAAMSAAVDAFAVEQAAAAEAALRHALIDAGVNPALMDSIPEPPAELPGEPPPLPDSANPGEVLKDLAEQAEKQMLDAEWQLKTAMAELGAPLPPGPL